MGQPSSVRLIVLSGLLFTALFALQARAVVLDVEQLPGRDRLLGDTRAVPNLEPGVAALAKGDAKQAERVARDAVARDPANSRAHLLLLLAWYAQHDDAAIARHLGEVDERLPDLGASLHETLASVYLKDARLYRADRQLAAIPVAHRSDQAEFLAAMVSARQNDLRTALNRLGVLAGRLPGSVPVATNQARLALLAQDFATTAAASQRLLKLKPDDEAARLMLATARMQQGRMGEAEAQLTQIVERNPRNGVAALNLALVQLGSGKTAAARKSFQAATALGTRDARPYYGEAVASLLDGDRAAAKTAAAAARKLNPADPLAALLDLTARGEQVSLPSTSDARRVAAGLFPDLERSPLPTQVLQEFATPRDAATLAAANVLLELWSPRAALEWLVAYHSASPLGPLGVLTKARALTASGDVAAARGALQPLAATAAGATMIGVDLQRAATAVAGGDRTTALSAIRAAVQKAPESARVRRLAGDFYNAVGQAASAVPEYRAALEATPGDPALLNQLAATLALLGERSGMEEGLKQAEAGLKARPDAATRLLLMDTRADLLFRLGRRKDALAAYDELARTPGGMQSPLAWHRLGDLRLEQNDRAGARVALEKALDFGSPYPGRDKAIAALAELDKASAS